MNTVNIPVSKARLLATSLLLAALAIGALAFLPGCASEPESHVVSAPPPNVVVPNAPTQVVVAQNPAPAGTVYITAAPPVAPQVVVTQPTRPSSEHVWVDSHWTYRNGRYEWINGQWERPPYSGARWVQPRSESRGDGTYQFYEGYWSTN